MKESLLKDETFISFYILLWLRLFLANIYQLWALVVATLLSIIFCSVNTSIFVFQNEKKEYLVKLNVSAN